MLGGSVQKTIRIVEGMNALAQIREMHFQASIIGVSSLSVDGGITYPSMDEAILKKAAFTQSQHVIAIANKEKLNSIAGFYATDISSISVLVTNETDETVLTPYRNAGIQIVTVSVNG